MKKIMVVYSIPEMAMDGINISGGTGAAFFDQMHEADQFKFDCECGCGGMAQVYEWNEQQHMYEFVYE